jgi:hypothetical protein
LTQIPAETKNPSERVVVAAPPRIIGTRLVAAALGVTRHVLAARVRAGEPVAARGYLGKIGNRHCWNAHEFYAGTFTDVFALERHVGALADATPVEAMCAVGGCDRLAGGFGVCPRHLGLFMRRLDDAQRSSLALVHLVALARWVLDRYPTVRAPHFDPWATTCQFGGCDAELSPSSSGPLCAEHTAVFYRTKRRS